MRPYDNKPLPKHKEKLIGAVRNKKLSVRRRLKNLGKESIVDYEINLRAMMAAFYCGTGGADIAKTTSFIGIEIVGAVVLQSLT